MLNTRRNVLLGVFGLTASTVLGTSLLGRPDEASASDPHPNPTHDLNKAVQNKKPADEISASDFVHEASDKEIDTVEKETGYSFSGTTYFDGGISEDFQSNLLPDSPPKEKHKSSKKEPAQKSPRIKTPRWYDSMSPEESYAFAERTIGIPAGLLRKIVQNESKGDPNIDNKNTGACGLGQLMPNDTLPEMAYKHSAMLGFDLNKSVRKFIIGQDHKDRNIIGYETRKGEKSYILNQCHISWVNVSLFSMNLIEKMRRVEGQLEKQGKRISNFTEADIYISHFLGARADIMLALRENPNKLAKDFVNKRTRSQNEHMFYDDKGHARTIAQMYAHISENGGPSATKFVSPFWRNSESRIAQRVEFHHNVG